MGDILLKENSSIRDGLIGLIGLIETLRQKTLPIHPHTHTTSAALAANTSSTTSLPSSMKVVPGFQSVWYMVVMYITPCVLGGYYVQFVGTAGGFLPKLHATNP